jgi:hypothetical protein
MAIYKPSHIVASISGSLSSQTFVQTKHGAIIRPRPRKIKKFSPQLLAQKARTSTARLAWANLDPATRLQWIATANAQTTTNRLGVRRNLSPYQFYVKSAIYAQLAGNAIPASPPNPIVNPPLTLAAPPSSPTKVNALEAIFQNHSDLYLIESWYVVPDSTRSYLLYGARSFSVTAIRTMDWWHFLGAYTVSNFGNINVIDIWSATMGRLADGEYYGLRVIDVTSPGLWSPVTQTILPEG